MNNDSASHLVSLTIIVVLAAGCGAPPTGPVTVTPIASPAAEGSGQAHLSKGPEEEVILSWLEPFVDGYALKFSTLQQNGWSEARIVSQGDDWMISWADVPSVEKISENLWAAHWLRNQPDEFHSYDAFLALSDSGGDGWLPPFLLHQDGTATEHGFVTLFPRNDGVAAAWLDGRNFIVNGEYEYEDTDGNLVGTSLRYAEFSPTGERLKSDQLDELVCDCCQTDVAHTRGGPVMAYRDRSREEVRNILVTRMADGQWQEAVPVSKDNWVIEGCPINGPAIAAESDDVAVAWFSGADNIPMVWFARSTDGGKSFGEPTEIDAEGGYGYVDVALVDSGDAIVSWLRSEGEGVALVIRRVSDAGLVGDIERITYLDTGRPADFPQMVYADDRLVFAWTEPGDTPSVRTAVADLSP